MDEPHLARRPVRFYYLLVQNDGNTVASYQTGTDAGSPVRVFWQTAPAASAS